MPFTFQVFNRRHDCFVTYTVTKTNEGWHVQHLAHTGNCDREGSPLFVANFDQNHIKYPADFGAFLEHIWNELHNGDIDDSTAQTMLQEVADWVTATEKSQPIWHSWNALPQDRN